MFGNVWHWPEEVLFDEKRALKIPPPPYSIIFLSVLHQNKVLHNFCKRGAASDSRMQCRPRIHFEVARVR